MFLARNIWATFVSLTFSHSLHARCHCAKTPDIKIFLLDNFFRFPRTAKNKFYPGFSPFSGGKFANFRGKFRARGGKFRENSRFLGLPEVPKSAKNGEKSDPFCTPLFGPPWVSDYGEGPAEQKVPKNTFIKRAPGVRGRPRRGMCWKSWARGEISGKFRVSGGNFDFAGALKLCSEEKFSLGVIKF